MPSSDPDDRRYSDEELALILRRTAEREVQAPVPATRGRTLAEIKAIAAEAGLDPSHVEQAAATVRAERRTDVAGVQERTEFAWETTVPAELTAPEGLELLDRARTLTRLRGVVKQEPDAVTWTGTDGFGVTRVAVAARLGRTKIQVSEDRTSSTMAAGFGGLLVGATLAVISVPVLLLTGIGVVPSVVLGGALGGLGAWGGVRLYFRRRAAKWQRRVEWLGAELETAARDLVGRREPGRLG